MAIPSSASFDCSCPHCAEQTGLVAPMLSPRPGAFTLRCLLDNCNRARAFMYLNGRIDLEIARRGVPYLRTLKLAGGPLEIAGDLIQDAAELLLIGQMNTDPAAKDGGYRGSAVHLRLASEFIAGGFILRLSDSERRNLQLGGMIGRIERGGGRARLRKGSKRVVLDSLDFIRRLGDTAAHTLLRTPSREVPPTKGNIEIGFDEMERLVGALKLGVP